MPHEAYHRVEWEGGGAHYDQVTYTSPLGRLSLIGECLITKDALDRLAPEALRIQSTENLQKLPGCYTTILEAESSCIVNTDPSGSYPVFWRDSIENGHESVTIGTDPSALGNEPDLLFLAANIANCKEATRGRSEIDKVNCLTGGQTARFVGGRLERLEEVNIAPNLSITLEEAALDMQVALRRAVENRTALGKCATSDCSGGFDSTILALEIAERTGGLDVFVHYLTQTGKADLRYAEAICAENPRMRLHKVDIPMDALPFQGLTDSEAYRPPGSFNTFKMYAKHWLEFVKGYGSELHVLGVGGDALFDPPIEALADLVDKRREQFAQSCQAYARTYNTSPTRLSQRAQATIGRTVNDDLLDLVSFLKSPQAYDDNSPFRWARQPNGGVAFLTESIRHQLSEASERQAADRCISEGIGIGEYVSLRGLQEVASIQCSLRSYARQAHGIDLHMPYHDRQVVAASLQLPAYMRMHPSVFKPLLQTAFSDVIPPVLANRTTKGEFSRAMYRGLRAALPVIRNLFTEDCLLEEFGVIDSQVVLREIDRLDMGLDGALPSLNEAIGAELWLRQQTSSTTT